MVEGGFNYSCAFFGGGLGDEASVRAHTLIFFTPLLSSFVRFCFVLFSSLIFSFFLFCSFVCLFFCFSFLLSYFPLLFQCLPSLSRFLPTFLFLFYFSVFVSFIFSLSIVTYSSFLLFYLRSCRPHCRIVILTQCLASMIPATNWLS